MTATEPVKLVAAIQQRPEPGARNRDGLPSAEITSEGGTYEQAETRLKEQLPDGWQMLYVMRT